MYYSTDGGQTWSEYTVQAFDGMPVGTVVLFAGETAPQYWMICDGTSLSEEEYPQLFDVIGYKYGGSNLSFNLPDLRGKVPVGLKSTDTSFDTLGETGGSKTTSYTPAGTNTGGSVGNHTLTVQEMPSHTHTMNTSMNAGANTTNDKVMSANYASSWNNNAHGELAIIPTGGGQAHNHPFTQPTFSGTQASIDIVQPYLTLNYIIKVTTNAPVMGSVVTVQNNSNVDTYSCSYINSLLNTIFPIGKTELFFDDADHSNYLGFTWELVSKGKGIMGYDPNDTDFNTIGKTGGSKSHTHTTQGHVLTVNEIPSHNHLYDTPRYYYGEPSGGGDVIGLDAGSTTYRFQRNTTNVGGGASHSHGDTGSSSNLDPYEVYAIWRRVS